MDSSLEGFVLEALKGNNFSMEEKRDLVHEISKWSEGAPDILQSWSRRELLQLLCEEMGKERKYTGLTKSKIIEHLLKTVSENKSPKRKDVAENGAPTLPTNNNQHTYKRQRKAEKPSRLPIATMSNSNADIDKSKFCQNLACRATLEKKDAFCKRCSCCICFQYDDNKDPSLWLVCSSEPPFVSGSCGMSCHLECAMKHEKSGITRDQQHKVLDGSFECVFCGKVNDLLSCWRKQLMTARDTRRVDVLCYRISLSQKLLVGTKKYQNLYEIVETAAKKLEAEVGPLSGLPVKMARGIVNRLSSGPDIQKLCAYAVETLDLLISSNKPNYSQNPSPRESADSCLAPSTLVRFENVNATSVTVILGVDVNSAEEITGYTLWHRKADAMNYPTEPTCTLFVPNTRSLLSDLSPATEYLLKVSPFNDARRVGTCEVKFTTSSVNGAANTLVAERDQSPTTNSSSLSNPSSEGNESNNNTACREQIHGVSGKGLQEMPADSASVLDEERAGWDDFSALNSAKPNIGQQCIDLPKPRSLLPEGQCGKKLNTSNGSDGSREKDVAIVPFPRNSIADPFTAPTKTGIISKDRPRSNAGQETSDEELYNEFDKIEKVTEVGSSTKKKIMAQRADDSFEKEYTHCVKMIRQLECEGYIEKNFRLKFLTWYSLRASPEDKRIVKVFIDTFADDPVGLAGQLVDTFSDDVNNRRQQGVLGNGFCMRLFH